MDPLEYEGWNTSERSGAGRSSGIRKGLVVPTVLPAVRRPRLLRLARGIAHLMDHRRTSTAARLDATPLRHPAQRTGKRTLMYDQTRAQQPADGPRGRAERRSPGPAPLFPSDERDRIARRLGRALNTFPDAPVESLEEAEAAFDETTAQLMEALAEQRRALREGWQDHDPETQSTELHLALRQYREITQRLLSL